jgi:hypothetical protein
MFGGTLYRCSFKLLRKLGQEDGQDFDLFVACLHVNTEGRGNDESEELGICGYLGFSTLF